MTRRRRTNPSNNADKATAKPVASNPTGKAVHTSQAESTTARGGTTLAGGDLPRTRTKTAYMNNAKYRRRRDHAKVCRVTLTVSPRYIDDHCSAVRCNANIALGKTGRGQGAIGA